MSGRIFSLSLLFGCILVVLCTGDASAAGETGGGYLAGYEEADPRLPLGPNRSVCVVELFGRIFVLGVTDTNIRLITEIDDPETVEEIRSAEPPAGGVFQEQFGSLSDFVQKIPPLFRK